MSLVDLRHQTLGAELSTGFHQFLQESDTCALDRHLRIKFGQYTFMFCSCAVKRCRSEAVRCTCFRDLVGQCLFLLIEGVQVWLSVDVLATAGDLAGHDRQQGLALIHGVTLLDIDRADGAWLRREHPTLPATGAKYPAAISLRAYWAKKRNAMTPAAAAATHQTISLVDSGWQRHDPPPLPVVLLEFDNFLAEKGTRPSNRRATFVLPRSRFAGNRDACAHGRPAPN